MYSRAARPSGGVRPRQLAGVESRGADLRARRPGRAGDGVGVGEVGGPEERLLDPA